MIPTAVITQTLVKIDTGKIAELRVELLLTLHGWHVLRLDSNKMAPNADLIAIRGNERITIQVKSTEANAVYFGSATDWITEKSGSIFNSKISALIADVVVVVVPKLKMKVMPTHAFPPTAEQSYNFYVFTVWDAESLAQECAWTYFNKPKLKSGAPKSPNIQIKIDPKTVASFMREGDLLYPPLVNTLDAFHGRAMFNRVESPDMQILTS